MDWVTKWLRQISVLVSVLGIGLGPTWYRLADIGLMFSVLEFLYRFVMVKIVSVDLYMFGCH